MSPIFITKKLPQIRINTGLLEDLRYNKYMENEVKNSANTSEDLVALRSENEKLKAEIKDLKQILEQLMEQLRLARHRRFGASSEKNTEAEQLSVFNEAEIYEDAEKAEEKLMVIAGHTRRKKKEYTLDKLPEGIPVEIVEHRIPESKLPVLSAEKL